MKKLLVCGVLAASVISGSGYVRAESRIGTVDLQRAVSESKEGIAARTSLQQKTEVLNAELKALLAEVDRLKIELEKGSEKLSADERAEKARLLQKKGRDFQNRQREAQEELKQTENDYLKKLLVKFGDILRKMGEDKDFTVILDKNQGVFYAGAKTDVTPELVKRADKEYQKD